MIGTQELDATPGQPSHRHRIRPGIFDNTRGQFRRRYDESFDRRLDEEDAIVRSCGEHQLWAQNVSGGIISGRSFCQEGGKPSAHVYEPGLLTLKPQRGSYALGSPSANRGKYGNQL